MPSGPLISVIDDDGSLRSALVELIHSLGYDVRGFESAESFINSDAVCSFACIITDIHMPGMSGIDLQRLLVKSQCAVPVIMITGRTEPGLEEKALASGAVCLLRKPFDADVLIDCLRKAMKH